MCQQFVQDYHSTENHHGYMYICKFFLFFVPVARPKKRDVMFVKYLLIETPPNKLLNFSRTKWILYDHLYGLWCA